MIASKRGEVGQEWGDYKAIKPGLALVLFAVKRCFSCMNFLSRGAQQTRGADPSLKIDETSILLNINNYYLEGRKTKQKTNSSHRVL